MSKDIVSGTLLLALAGGYYWATRQIAVSSLADDVGPDGIPNVLAATLAIVAGLILVRGVLALRRRDSGSPVTTTGAAAPADAGDDDDHYEASLARALGLLAIGSLYIVVAMLAGYIPALIVLILATALYEGLPFGWQPVAVAIGGSIGFWLLFVKLLGTEQPIGLLRGLV